MGFGNDVPKKKTTPTNFEDGPNGVKQRMNAGRVWNKVRPHEKATSKISAAPKAERQEDGPNYNPPSTVIWPKEADARMKEGYVVNKKWSGKKGAHAGNAQIAVYSDA
jgi:hypothetical protein